MTIDEIDKEKPKEEEHQDGWIKSYHDTLGEHYPVSRNILNTNEGNNIVTESDYYTNNNSNNNSHAIDVHELRSKINYHDFIEYTIDLLRN